MGRHSTRYPAEVRERAVRLSRTAHATFVLDALEQAIHAKKPARRSGLVHHSDSEYLRAGSLGVT